MTTNQLRKTIRLAGSMLIAVAGLASVLLTGGVSAEETTSFRAVFVEPYGGPNHSLAECPPGTSCGTAHFGSLGHGTTLVVFDACGAGCQERTITFSDGSQLFIEELGNLADFASPGSSGNHGYIGFGLPGNPQLLDVTLTITGGTGRFTGATGSGEGIVKVAGGVATIKVTGTITFP